MKTTRLGRTGLEGTRLRLGCEDPGRPFIRRALDLRLKFFDTAQGHSGGTCAEIVGRSQAPRPRHAVRRAAQ